MKIIEIGDVELVALSIPVRAAFEIDLTATVEDQLFDTLGEIGGKLQLLEVALRLRHDLVVIVVGRILPEIAVEPLGFQRVLERPGRNLPRSNAPTARPRNFLHIRVRDDAVVRPRVAATSPLRPRL